MEYTQWVTEDEANKLFVLILVVMEYTQWDEKGQIVSVPGCLNPCCNGIYSMRRYKSCIII